MSAKAKKVTKIIVNVFLWIFMVFALLTTIFAFMARANSKGYPRIGNTCFLVVKSGSMAVPGGFYTGDLIICTVLSDTEKTECKKGEVITFYIDLKGNGVRELNTHRIVEEPEKVGEYVLYTTKGDANDGIDPQKVPDSDVEAKWTGKRIAGLGAVIGFLQSGTGFFVCIVLPLAIFFVYEIIVLVITIKNTRDKKKPKLSAEEEEEIKRRAVEEYLAKQQSEKAAETEVKEEKETLADTPEVKEQEIKKAEKQQEEKAEEKDAKKGKKEKGEKEENGKS